MDKRIIFIVTIIISIGAFFVLPVDDDFYYLTAPHLDFSLESLLPNGPFWRPFDVILGFCLGKCPSMFPFINHAIVLIGFAYAIYGLNRILQFCNVSKMALTISLVIFCLSPALVATTYSVDSSNQSISLALGIASLIYFEKHKTGAYILMILSVLAKESGMAWFAITPMLNLLMQKMHNLQIISAPLKTYIKSLIKPWCISACIIIIYALTRLFLNTHIDQTTEETSRYAVRLGFNTVTGLGMILTSASTIIDTIALFLERNWFILGTSAIASIAIMLLYIKKIAWKNTLYLLILLVCVLAISSPHIIMTHPAEMHVYPTLWMVALSLGILTSKAVWTKRERMIIFIYISHFLFLFSFIKPTIYIE